MWGIVFRPKAQADVASMRKWYRALGDGSEERFDADMDETLTYLSRFPKNFSIRHRNYRFSPMVRFKYFIIYRIVGSSVVVHRVRHQHQKTLRTYFGP